MPCPDCKGGYYCNARCHAKNFNTHKIPCMRYSKFKTTDGMGGKLENYLKWELLDWTDKDAEYLTVGMTEPKLVSVRCSGCKVPEEGDVKMKECQCGSVQYCTEKCRKKGWNKHKKACRRLLKAAKNRKKNPNHFV